VAAHQQTLGAPTASHFEETLRQSGSAQLALALTEKWNLRRLAQLRTDGLEEWSACARALCPRARLISGASTDSALDLITLLDADHAIAIKARRFTPPSL